MAGRRKRGSVLEADEFNLTPLIDCVFLLLIFFMVTTVFKNPAQLKLQLPVAQSSTKLDKRQLLVELDEEGNIALNSKELAMSSFDAYLQVEKSAKNINSLLIKADINAKHGDVLKLMKMARGIQIETIALATDSPPEK